MYKSLFAFVALASSAQWALAQSSFSQSQSRPVEVRRAEPRVARAVPVQSGPSENATFRPGDSFELRLSGMPAEDSMPFALQFTIGTDGFVNVPLSGQVRASGLTQSQLEKAIERQLVEAKIFRWPTATINVAQAARFVTVGGAVRAPNRIPWSSDLSILSAIASVGGPGDFGGDKIEMIRNGKISVFSMKKLRRDPSQDPRLFPGDQLELR